MASTTKDIILAIAPELNCFTDPVWELIIADVNEQVGSEFGGKQEAAQRYLASHILTQLLPTANKESMGGVKSEKLAQRTVTYSDASFTNAKNPSSYNSTVYGRMFESIKKQCVLGFAVVKP